MDQLTGNEVMLVAEDLGQKRIHDSSETAMVLGSQGKSNEIGYFNGPIVQNISDNREKSEKIVTDEHIRGMKLVEFLEDKTDCKQPGLSNSIKWATIGCRHQSQVAGWGLKADQILKYPKPFIEGFRLSLQCLLPRRTWDPGITWLKILKEHLEDKGINTKILDRTHYKCLVSGMSQDRPLKVKYPASTNPSSVTKDLMVPGGVVVPNVSPAIKWDLPALRCGTMVGRRFRLAVVVVVVDVVLGVVVMCQLIVS
ncbi:hypothetical protein Tco_0664809, partial [Tanacetum coccineum]